MRRASPAPPEARLPGVLVWVVIGVSLLPAALILAGVDLGSPRTAPLAGLPAGEDEAFRAMAGSFAHTILEWSAVAAAAFTAVLAFVHAGIRRDAAMPLIGAALLTAGAVDAFHVLAADRLISAATDNRLFIPFTWAISRTFNAVVLLAGAGLVLASGALVRRVRMRGVLSVGGGFVLVALAVMYASARAAVLPETYFPEAPIKRPWDIGPLVLFIVAGLVVLPRFHRRHSSLFSHALLISMVPQVLTQLHMVFGSAALYDAHFNAAHGLKILAYAVPFLGLALDHVQTYRSTEAQAYGELREGERRYRMLFDSNPHPMWVFDRESFAFLEVNDAAVHQYGYSRDEFLSMSIRDIRPPEDVPALMEDVERTGAYSPPTVWRHRKRDGTLIDVEISANDVPFGGRPSRLVLAEDVTERRRAEEALLRQRERLEILYETAQAILEAGSPEQIASAALGRLRRLLNCSRTSIVTFDTDDDEAVVFAVDADHDPRLAPGDRLPVEVFGGREAFRGGETRVVRDLLEDAPRTDTIRRLRTEGVRSYANVPLVAGGSLLGSLNLASSEPDAFGVDELEVAGEVAAQIAVGLQQAHLREDLRRHSEELEERVARRTAELRQANAELEAFAYSVSHDLRGPLRRIDGFGRALLEELEESLDPNGRHYLTRIRENTSHMGRLIDDLLTLSRLTRAELSRERVDLSQVAGEVAGELRAAEPDRAVKVAIAPNVEAVGDRRLLRILLQNLLGNAWKFTRSRPEPTIEFGRAEDGGEVVYFVRDDGVGFEMEYADKLFVPFQRLHAQADYEGSGVGLATVQRIVHRHRGRVWATGEVGTGATFWFTLGPPHPRAHGNTEDLS